MEELTRKQGGMRLGEGKETMMEGFMHAPYSSSLHRLEAEFEPSQLLTEVLDQAGSGQAASGLPRMMTRPPGSGHLLPCDKHYKSETV